MWSPYVLGRTRRDHQCRWKNDLVLHSDFTTPHVILCFCIFEFFCWSCVFEFSISALIVWRAGESRMARRRITASIYYPLYMYTHTYSCFTLCIMAGALWLSVLSGGCFWETQLRDESVQQSWERNLYSCATSVSLSYIRSCVCTRSTCVPPCDSYIALAKRSCTRRCPRALRFVNSHWMALVTVCHDCPENNRLNCLFFGCSLFYAYVGIILIVVMLCKWTCACFSFVLWWFTNTCCVWNIPYTCEMNSHVFLYEPKKTPTVKFSQALISIYTSHAVGLGL